MGSLAPKDTAAFARVISFLQATLETTPLAAEDAAAFNRTLTFLQATLDTAPVDPPPPQARRKIVWGAKVSSIFRDRVWWICDTLGFDPDDLMSCMAWESGRTFSANIGNRAGSGAVGLIQFMPSTAQHLGTSSARLAAMTAEDQLNYVYKYLRPWGGRVHNLSDLYMTILWPLGVGKPEDYVVFDGRSGGIAYRQNAGFDTNGDKEVTKAEASAKLVAIKAQGAQYAA